MSYGQSHNGPTRRTAPLIQRPSASAPAPPASPLHSTGSTAGLYALQGYQTQPQGGHYNPAFAAAHAYGAYQQQPYPYPNQLGHSYPPQHPYPAAHLQYGGAQPYSAHYSAGGAAAAAGGTATGGGAYTDSVAAGPSRVQAQPPSMYPPRVPVPGPSGPSHAAHGLPARPAIDSYPDPSSSRAVPSSSSSSSFNSTALPPAGRSRKSRTNAGGGPQPSRGPDLVQCSQADCTYSGTRKQVREHEEDRHLIYAPGREPKPWSGSLKPLEGAVIEGTGISLDTPEAVARWIQERKKRWPSNKVVEEKEKARAERVAAGLEAPPRERGGGRGRGRGGRGRGGGGFGHADFAARDAVGAPGRTRDAQEDAPSAGTAVEADEPASKKVKLEDGSAAFTPPPAVRKYGDDRDYDDASADEQDDDDDSAPEEASAKPNAASQGSKSEPADRAPSSASVSDQRTTQPDDGAATPDGSTPAEAPSGGEPQKRFQVVCRHWRRGNCALGDAECPYLHHLPPNAGPPPPPKRRRPAPAPAPHNPFARPAGFSDPFSLVEERDYRHIVADVLQVIEFLGANEWLRGVEIRRGQVDEESGIEVLHESETPRLKGLAGESGGKSVRGSTAIVELAAAPGPDLDVADSSSTSTAEPSEPAEVTEAPSPPLVPASGSTALPPVASKPPVAGLFADYGSDSDDDDEADEQAVASALMAGA